MGAVGIIRNSEKVLLERRADSKDGLSWRRIEDGRITGRVCAKRSQRRDGPDRGRLKLLDIFSYPYRIAAYPDGNIVRIITAVYEVFVKDLKELKCSEESRELRFFGRNELSDLTIAETHQDILLFYIKHSND